MGRINLDELFVWARPRAIRVNRDRVALDHLEEGLLYNHTTDISGTRSAIPPGRNLIDFVNDDNSTGRTLHVPVRRDPQALDDAFNIFTDIPRFGEAGAIGDHKRHIE